MALYHCGFLYIRWWLEQINAYVLACTVSFISWIYQKKTATEVRLDYLTNIKRCKLFDNQTGFMCRATGENNFLLYQKYKFFKQIHSLFLPRNFFFLSFCMSVKISQRHSLTICALYWHLHFVRSLTGQSVSWVDFVLLFVVPPVCTLVL